MIEPISELSEAGRRRKEQILQIALASAQTRRRRRRTGQAIAFAALAVALFSVVWPRVHLTSPPKSPIAIKHQVPQNSLHSIVISRISDDPTIVTRLAIPEPPNTIQRIGDDQLLDELAKASEPAGLAYIDGKTVLMYR